MTLFIVLSLVWIHSISDFLVQKDKRVLARVTGNKRLLIHCIIYSVPFLIFGLEFAAITLALHFVVDFLSSRGTSYLWKKRTRRWFFALIGFDQAVHLTVLVLTYKFLKGF